VPNFQHAVHEYDPVAVEEPAEKPVATQADIDAEEALHEHRCPRCESRSAITRRRLPWIVATAALSVLCLWLLLTRPESRPPAAVGGSWEGGYDNELGEFFYCAMGELGLTSPADSIKPKIRVHPVTFSGSPRFDDHGNGTVPTRPGSMAYVGDPSPALDDAWEGLVGDRSFLLTEEEARDAWGPDYWQFYNTDRQGYLSGLSTLHGLSCLNLLRQFLDPDYYPKWKAAGATWHADHCVEHLRQMLMCSGDATPIPSRWEENIGQWYVYTDRTHTCRDFKSLREWITMRAKGLGEGSVKPGEVHAPGEA
jgi:hypothetical protein